MVIMGKSVDSMVIFLRFIDKRTLIFTLKNKVTHRARMRTGDILRLLCDDVGITIDKYLPSKLKSEDENSLVSLCQGLWDANYNCRCVAVSDFRVAWGSAENPCIRISSSMRFRVVCYEKETGQF